MIDMYGLGSSGIPLEYSAELRRLQQQQMIAQSLMQQSQEDIPTNQMAGGFVVPVSPFQGLGKVAQAYMAGRMMQGGNSGYKALGEKYTADQNSAIDKVKSAMAPTAAVPIPLANANGVEGQMIERSPAEKRAAAQEAMLSQFPNVRNFGTVVNSNIQADQAREDAQAHQRMLAEETAKDRALAREQAEQSRRDLMAQQFEQQKILKAMSSQGQGQGQSPYFQPVQTSNGVFAFNARTGKVEPVAGPDGKPIVGAQFDPSLQGSLAGAKAGGKELGEAGAKAKLDLPGAIDKASLASQQIDDLLKHPGFSSTVGATLRPGARFVDGSPESDFMKRLDQLKGGAFLQAFESLKGGGQITEAEGKKATEAISRMDKAQSEKEFTAAAREFQGFINKGVERAKGKAGVVTTKPQGPSIESLLDKYK